MDGRSGDGSFNDGWKPWHIAVLILCIVGICYFGFHPVIKGL